MSSHDQLPMAIWGWYVTRLCATQDGQVCRVVSPHPGKAELAVTVTAPVDCSAARMPSELSNMTLSPKICTR